MKIGILSDTHGHVEKTKRALKLLKEAQVDQYIHCGDLGSEDVLYAMASEIDLAKTPLTAVWGNVDRWDPALPQFPILEGLTLKPDQASLDFSGKKALVIHGDDQSGFRRAVLSGKYDFVFTGHTHVAEDRMEGSTRVINPGAVYRSPEPSVAVLDLEKDELENLFFIK